MKKIDKFEGRRYYPEETGMFVDIERYNNDIILSMGTKNPVYVFCKGEVISTTAKMECCRFVSGYSLEDEECMEAFKKVLFNYKSAYCYYYISEDLVNYPFEGEETYANVNMENFRELETVRYAHTFEGKKYYLDVEVEKDPNNPEYALTKVYLKYPEQKQEAFCEAYEYQVPEEKHKDILKNKIAKYIWIAEQTYDTDMPCFPGKYN